MTKREKLLEQYEDALFSLLSSIRGKRTTEGRS